MTITGDPLTDTVEERIGELPASDIDTDLGELVRLDARGEAGRTRRVPRGLERLLGVVLLFTVWETASQLGWLDPRLLAGPSTVLTAGWDLLRDGTLVEALWVSAKRVLWGLGIGIPLGTALALVASLTRLGDDLVDANLQMLRFVPIIALQPLFILWLGVGETVKISMIVLGVTFPVYVNTSAAVRAQTFFASDVIVVCLVIYAVLGLLRDAAVRFLERKVLAWQPGR